jgi:hypothetical protein
LADEKEEGAGSGDSGSPAKPPGSVRLPLIICGVLILLFGGVSALNTKSKPKPFKTEGSRAVVLPAGDRQRVVVVPPCSPRVVVNEANASSMISVPGVVAVGVPVGGEPHTVVIPRCAAKAAPMPGSANIPSAAFMLGPGKQVFDVSKVPKGGDPIAYGIKEQVQIPTGSAITTVVAPPCQGKAAVEKTTVLSPDGPDKNIGIAPDC